MAGTLYTTPCWPGHTELFPEIVPGVSEEHVELGITMAEAPPLQVPFEPDTVIVPPAKFVEKFTRIEFVLVPDAMEAPSGKTH